MFATSGLLRREERPLPHPLLCPSAQSCCRPLLSESLRPWSTHQLRTAHSWVRIRRASLQLCFRVFSSSCQVIAK